MRSDLDVIQDDDFSPPVNSTLAFVIGFFFSFRMVISLVSVRLLGADPQVGAETRLVLNFLLLGLVCFLSLGNASRTIASIFRLASIRWVLLFLAFSGCSLMWSSAASLTASLAYWCGTASDVVMLLVLLHTGCIKGVADSLIKGFVWCTCLIAVMVWLIPGQSDMRLGDEDLLNSNNIGNLCAFAIFLSQYLIRRQEGKWGLQIAFLSITLLRSLSKTTIVAFLVSQIYLMIRDRSMSRRTKTLIGIGFLVAILAFWGLFESYYDVYTNAGNESETLTGRTGIWAYFFTASLEQPWIGHGFDSMWKVVPSFGVFEARHAENEMLELFYSYGVAGMILFVGLYGSLFRQIRRLTQSPLKVLFVSMLLFVIIRGFAEADPFDLVLPLWMIVLISMIASSVDTNILDPMFAEAAVGQILPAV